MAAWSRLRTASSSPPATSPSSSSSSSSASLHPALVFDLADELWFYRSVVSLPSLSLPPCLPSLFSSSLDSSTLIAQCMITSSSSFSPTPPSNSQLQTHISPFLPAFAAYPAPPDLQEDYANAFCAYDGNETAYGGYGSLIESEEDEDAYWGYPRASAGEDEEAYYYYSAASDWDDDDNYHGYHAPSDCEDEQQAHVMKEEVLHADAPQLPVHLEPDDALSGIYDVGVLLKDQHQKRTQEVSYSRFQGETMSRVAAHPPNQAPSDNELGDLKENIKLWAHLVVSTLPRKAAAQARPLL